jgi:hypothetical protein
VWVIVSIRPHQDHNSVLEPSQANEPLLAIRFSVVFPGEHLLIEDAFALRQIDPMLAQVEFSLGGVIAHVLFIVYALNGWRNGVAEQVRRVVIVAGTGHRLSFGRSAICLISGCEGMWHEASS